MTQAIARAYAPGPHGEIHYAVAGRGEPVLLLHQTPRSWEEFHAIMKYLAGEDVWTIGMDLPGMGASHGPEGSPTIEDFADAAIALLDALDIGAAHMFGHHTGSFVAVDLAARHPERVKSLMLSAPTWVDGDMLKANPDGLHADVDSAQPTESGNHAVRLWRSRQPFYPAGRTDLLNAYLRDALRVSDPRAGHDACDLYQLENAVSRVECRTLILAHDKDPHSFKDLGEFTRRLPAAEVVVLEGGMVPLELHPDRVAQIIRDFVTRQPPGA